MKKKLAGTCPGARRRISWRRRAAATTAGLVPLSVSAVLLAVSVQPVAASGPNATWTEAATTGPLARMGASMAYDPATSQLLLFGGVNNISGYLGDTWTWSGAGWTEVASTGPSRFLASMAYDPATSQLVLFGGYSRSGFLGDTWIWDGTGWTQAASRGPSARYGTSMAYDPATSQLVLFGGYEPGGFLGDTWTWNGTGWAQVATTGPSPRYGAQMADAPGTSQLMLFGGDGAGGVLGDSWTWGGSDWTPVAAAGPSSRYMSSMAGDPATSQVVLFGGLGASGVEMGDTWGWSGSAWSQVATTGPPARIEGSMAYDPATSTLVLFGGYNSGGYPQGTWTWGFTTDTDLVLTGVPRNLTVDATSPAGAMVTYTPPTAADEDSPAAATVSCTPASGSTFAIGTTAVSCTASDADDVNGPVTASFTVTVMGAAAQLADLHQATQGQGPGASLSQKLQQAQSDLTRGNLRSACGQLGAFVNEVTAQSGKSISASEASALTGDAGRIEAVLAC